ncbi:hypothetical protein KIPB_002792, partial [Kipferlia bialata]
PDSYNGVAKQRITVISVKDLDFVRSAKKNLEQIERYLKQES